MFGGLGGCAGFPPLAFFFPWRPWAFDFGVAGVEAWGINSGRSRSDEGTGGRWGMEAEERKLEESMEKIFF